MLSNSLLPQLLSGKLLGLPQLGSNLRLLGLLRLGLRAGLFLGLLC